MKIWLDLVMPANGQTNDQGEPMKKETEMKKKLKINAGVCDVSRVTEKTLEAYSHITVNAARLVTSQKARELLSAIHFTANVGDTLEAVEGSVLQVQNGAYTITAGPAPNPKVVLMVNGMLTVEQGAQEALGGYAAIAVNGKALYPRSLSGALAGMTVNGKSEAYPDGAVLLKSPAVIDQVFALRAKDSLYYSSGTLVMVDEALNAAALANKGARFQAKRAIIREQLVEQAMPLLDEQTDIVIVKQGYAYLQGDQVVSEQLVRRHGQQLFVDGDLSINHNALEALSQIRGLHVTGQVMLPENLLDAFMGLDAVYKSLFTIRGHLIADKVATVADAALMKLYPQGVTFHHCVNITVDPALSPEEIRQRLRFIACVQIRCAPAQQSAVHAVSTDVVSVQAEEGKASGVPFADMEQPDQDTEVISAALYVL